jgi:hypothetical protein
MSKKQISILDTLIKCLTTEIYELTVTKNHMLIKKNQLENLIIEIDRMLQEESTVQNHNFDYGTFFLFNHQKKQELNLEIEKIDNDIKIIDKKLIEKNIDIKKYTKLKEDILKRNKKIEMQQEAKFLDDFSIQKYLHENYNS